MRRFGICAIVVSLFAMPASAVMYGGYGGSNGLVTTVPEGITFAEALAAPNDGKYIVMLKDPSAVATSLTVTFPVAFEGGRSDNLVFHLAASSTNFIRLTYLSDSGAILGLFGPYPGTYGPGPLMGFSSPWYTYIRSVQIDLMEDWSEAYLYLDAIEARYHLPLNQPPVAVNDNVVAQINSAVTVNVLANDSDPEGETPSLVSYTQGANGTVAAAEGGLTYTPNLDFYGTDSFTYTIKDSKNATATATVTVTVNKAPVAAPDAGQTEVGVAITISVLVNDHDDNGDTLTVTAVGTAANGNVTLSSNGAVTYSPNTGFAGQDQFSYTIGDGKGGTSTAEVYIVVNPKNVLIDIKPGSYPNSINLGSNGVVPVAILSTDSFDATTVDPATVSLAGADVAMRGKGNRYLASNQDVNADGRLDLVLQIETENLNPADLQDGYGTVVGTTTDGIPIIGTDEITIVPQ